MRGSGVRRSGAVAGLAGTSIAVLLTGVLHTVWQRFPFPPVSVAEAVARRTPGGVATYFIDRLQHRALPLAVVAVAIGLVGASLALGTALPWLVDRVPGGRFSAALAAAAPLYAAAIAAFQPMSTSVGLGVYAVVLAAVTAVGAAFTARTYGRLVAGTPDRRDGRREVVRALWVGAAGLLLGWAELGRVIFPRPNPGRLALSLREVATASPPPPQAAFDQIEGLSPRITTNDDFYVVDEEIVDPDVDPEGWRLTIEGAVDRPFTLGYAQLTAQPAVERFITLECISNPVGGDLISTARWTGIPLPRLLERAGVRAGAVEVVFRAIGGYSDSLPLDAALREVTMIAIGMNGRVLPREHGFPARLLAPGYFGMKQPKWLESIEVVTQPYTGYWEQRGWIKAAVVKTMSRIDTLGAAAAPYTIAGVAFAGDRGIRSVEVSTDGGTTWMSAQLEAPLSEDTWVRWRFPFSPAGTSPEDVFVRAVDGTGQAQIRALADPHPSGSSGYDGVRF
jgi:DMSO/TMAO reductase YedYZ molybdopterin-dependent catalytic subunit